MNIFERLMDVFRPRVMETELSPDSDCHVVSRELSARNSTTCALELYLQKVLNVTWYTQCVKHF